MAALVRVNIPSHVFASLAGCHSQCVNQRSAQKDKKKSLLRPYHPRAIVVNLGLKYRVLVGIKNLYENSAHFPNV